MTEKRINDDRRENADRRKSIESSHSDPEKREMEYRRLDINRRKKEETD